MRLVIEIGSAANAPTISNSGLCGAIPSVLAGYLSTIFRFVVAVPYANESL